jgi:two-component system, cell cycle sensor histidine kinase and response regulator CckA
MSGRQYQWLFENNPKPMWVFDRNTLAFLAVNDAAVGHYGYSRQEFLHMTILDIRPSEDVVAVLKNALLDREHGLQDPQVWRHEIEGGSIIDVEITGHELIFEGREAELILANDITESKKSCEELQQSEKRSINAANVLAVIHDLTENIGPHRASKIPTPAEIGENIRTPS